MISGDLQAVLIPFKHTEALKSMVTVFRQPQKLGGTKGPWSKVGGDASHGSHRVVAPMVPWAAK